MHHSLYPYNEANNNTVNNSGIESIYATLTANQLPLRDALPTAPGSAVPAAVDPAMAMGNRTSMDVAALVDRAMSIDDHLQSMPLPLTGWNDQFRSQDELDMLSMGSAGRSVLQGPSLPCQLHNVIVSRCDGGVASSSDTSSSSCSPSSTENLHQQQHRQHQQQLKSSDASLDSTVASILNHSLKPEPSDPDFSVEGPNGSATASTHRLPMQPMSLHLAAGYGGRCSNDSGVSGGAMSTTSSSGTPTPVRRSRSSHDGMLKCQFCPKKWADQAALHTHMADCRMMRGHECAQCGKRFKARGGLQQHLRIHSNDRPYACHFCAKRFTQKSHVDQHERIHTGAKPFTCQFCGRAFRQRSQQLGHEATHTNSMSNNNAQMATSPSTQQQTASTAPSPLPQQHQQQQRGLLRNEFQTPNGLLQELQPPSSTSSSSFSGCSQLNLLTLGQVTPSSCTNNAVSSLLALSSSNGHNQSTSSPTSSQHHFNAATSQLHQAAVGLLNGLH
ncbi:hypothetical protein V3C99_003505 [Haemonchus contortus]